MIPLVSAALSQGTGYQILNINYNRTRIQFEESAAYTCGLEFLSSFGEEMQASALQRGNGFRVDFHGGVPRSVGPFGAVLHTCSVNFSLNPFLYPVNSFFQDTSKSNAHTVLTTGRILEGEHASVEVREGTISTALFPELLKNIPYMLFVAFIVETLLERVFRGSLAKLKVGSPNSQ